MHEHYEDERASRLVHHRGRWYAWAGKYWPEAEDRRVRADLYQWLEDAFYLKAGEPEPFAPTKRKIADVLEALAAGSSCRRFLPTVRRCRPVLRAGYQLPVRAAHLAEARASGARSKPTLGPMIAAR